MTGPSSVSCSTPLLGVTESRPRPPCPPGTLRRPHPDHPGSPVGWKHTYTGDGDRDPHTLTVELHIPLESRSTEVGVKTVNDRGPGTVQRVGGLDSDSAVNVFPGLGTDYPHTPHFCQVHVSDTGSSPSTRVEDSGRDSDDTPHKSPSRVEGFYDDTEGVGDVGGLPVATQPSLRTTGVRDRRTSWPHLWTRSPVATLP